MGATWEPPWVSAMSSRPETLLNSDSATVPGAGGERLRAAAVQPPAGSGAGVCVCVHAPPACGLSRSQRAARPDSPVAPAGGTGTTPAARGPVPVAPPWSAPGRGAHHRGWPRARVSCREHQRLRVNPAGLLPRDLQQNPDVQVLPHAAVALRGRVGNGAPPPPAPRSLCSAGAWGPALVIFRIDERGGRMDSNSHTRTWLPPPAPHTPAPRGRRQPLLSAHPGDFGCSFHRRRWLPARSGESFPKRSRPLGLVLSNEAVAVAEARSPRGSPCPAVPRGGRGQL